MKKGSSEKQDSSRGQISQGLLSNLNRHRPRSYSLRMMPMIDVIFLLLIFFLVTAKFRPHEDYLPVVLPSSSEGVNIGLIEPLLIELSSTQTGLNILIGEYEEIDIPDDKVETGIMDLEILLRDIIAGQNRTVKDPVELDCQDNLKWEHLALVYNMLYGMGVTDITFPLTE